MIQISAEYGEPKAKKAIRPLHHNLNQIFEKRLNKKYFVKLEKLAIVLRVSGQVVDFKGDGLERLKYKKNWNLVTIDFVIPEARWKGVDQLTLRTYFAGGIKSSFELLLEKAKSLGEVIEEDQLKNDFLKSIKDFLEV